MQRKAYVPGLAALLAALVTGVTGLTGCSADSGSGDSGGDSKPGEGKSSAAQPGRYRTLLEPCGSLEASTLKDLLPGIVELPREAQEKILAGAAAVTYDTDRRVGCSWKADTPDATRTLSLDFERVVSYDSAVSDDDRAQRVYEKKQTAADLPLVADAGNTGNTGNTGDTGDTGDTEQAPASPSPSTKATTTAPAASAQTVSPPPSPSGTGTGTGSPTGTTSPDGLQPRVLDDLGDAAFLNDVLSTAGTGSTAQRRTVSVVFRTSNVIVTIVYGEQSARTADAPDSKELQDKAQSLARSLVEQFSE